MMTGSAIAIPWEAENVPAIINAWYAGQSAGTAIADVLFGDYNPAGRLPVTFYKKDSDLPDFNDYSMENRTYRYFKGEPLFGFGYGLSYTTFKYDNLKVPATYNGRSNLSVSVRVTNTGKMDGEEVVQLYVSNLDKTLKAPIRTLKGFQRVFLKKGENKVIYFSLPSDAFSVLSTEHERVLFKGKFEVSIGGAQPGTKAELKSNIVQSVITIQ
jgi:beta-glucosidase